MYIYIYLLLEKRNLVPLKCPQNKQESNIKEPRFADGILDPEISQRARSRHPFRKSSMSSGDFEYKNANATSDVLTFCLQCMMSL